MSLLTSPHQPPPPPPASASPSAVPNGPQSPKQQKEPLSHRFNEFMTSKPKMHCFRSLKRGVSSALESCVSCALWLHVLFCITHFVCEWTHCVFPITWTGKDRWFTIARKKNKDRKRREERRKQDGWEEEKSSQASPESFMSRAHFRKAFLHFPLNTSKSLIFYLDFTKKGSLDSIAKASSRQDEELEVTVYSENNCLIIAAIMQASRRYFSLS